MPAASGLLGVRVARVPAVLTVTVAGTSAVLPAARRRKVLVVIEAAFIALLNVAVTVVLSGTPVAPGAGACAVTVGATSVVKLQRESAPSAVPLVSVTAEAGRAAWRESAEISVVGVSLEKEPAVLTVTVAGTSAVLPAARRRKVLVVIEAAFIALLNVAVTVVLSGTPVAPGAGACAVTVGATSVVKLQRESAPSAVPIVSVTAAATVEIGRASCRERV